MCILWVLLGLAILSVPWIRSMFRDVPWIFAARRCLATRKLPGPKAFWTRLNYTPAFVIETILGDGRIISASVVCCDIGKSTLAALAGAKNQAEAWEFRDGKYTVNLSPYLGRLPNLRGISVIAEYNEGFGTRFLAQWSPTA